MKPIFCCIKRIIDAIRCGAKQRHDYGSESYIGQHSPAAQPTSRQRDGKNEEILWPLTRSSEINESPQLCKNH
jgi:hypothetical protein